MHEQNANEQESCEQVLGEHEVPFDPYEKEVVEEEVKLVINDREDYLLSSEKVDIDTLEKNSAVIIPTATYKEMVSFVTHLNGLSKTQIKENLSKQDLNLAGLVNYGVNVTINDNLLVNKINSSRESWVSSFLYADKELGLRNIPLKKNTGKLTGEKASIALFSAIGKGSVIQVPLWHSGFHITLKPIKEADLIDLEMHITNSQITLGRDTANMVYSNYNVVFARIVIDFIVARIHGTTVDLAANANIKSLIKIQDIYPLVLALTATLYPKGYDLIRGCINGINIDKETNGPKCNATLKAKIDPRKLLKVDRDGLTDKHKVHMTKLSPNSTTKEEVLEYQRTLAANQPKDKKITTDEGNVITLTLDVPSVTEYIINGNLWIDNIINLAEAGFTSDLTVDEKNTQIYNRSLMSVLGMYSHYIKKITTSDGGYIEGVDDINKNLDILVSDDRGFKETIDAIKSFIDERIVSLVAIPTYECPVCSAEQVSENTKNVFSDFIPLNMFQHFFDLSTYRVNKTLSKGQAILDT